MSVLSHFDIQQSEMIDFIMEKVNRRQQPDILHGSLWKALPQFAIPVATTAILEQLFNASDLAVVGNFSQQDSTVAVAAVGANSPLIGLIVNLFIGIALDSNVVIAHAVGQGKKEAVEKAVHTSVIVALLGGIGVALLGELVAAPVLRLLQVPQEAFSAALLYLRIYLCGMPVILLYNFEAAIFRSIGETKVPLIALAGSGVLNVLLNLFFVVVLHRGVDGVAVATVISNAVSAAVLFFCLLHTKQSIRLQLRRLRIDPATLGQILRIGLPAGIQSALFSVSNIVIQSAVNSLGTDAMAASSAALNIELITYDILNAFAQACTTFVGQNFGAGSFPRCKKILFCCLLEGGVVLGAAIALILSLGKPLLSVFGSTEAVLKLGYLRLVIVMLSHFFSLLYEVFSGYLRGFGISFVPAVLTMLGVCCIRIAWIQFVFVRNQTFQTILIAYPISLFTTALLLFVALLCYHPAKRFGKTVRQVAD